MSAEIQSSPSYFWYSYSNKMASTQNFLNTGRFV